MNVKTARKHKTPASKNGLIEITPTGIAGLDDVLAGGLPRNCFYLVQGNPGSGKTTLALQFLLEGLRRGENVFYITLSETKEELQKVAVSHDWSLDDVHVLDLSAIEGLLQPEAQTTVFHPSELQLTKVSRLLLEEASKLKPARVAFDSLSEFRLMAETALRYRRELLRLKQEFTRFNSTVLLIDDKMGTNGSGVDPHVLSLTHGVIDMEQLSPDYGTSRRRLRVSKLRAMQFRDGYHDYIITHGGLQVFPRIVAAEHHTEFQHDPVSSGLAQFDALLGGGLDRGTTTLILGPAGTGKSTLALQYAAQVASNGEQSLIFAFDETRSISLTRARVLGIGIEKGIRNGSVTVQQVDPAELSPQLHELCAYLNQQGAITILILAQHGLLENAQAPVDLSYLSDTVITLRYFEAFGSVRQALAVVKKRSGHHERTIREFRLESDKGISIGEPLREFQGVLTGVPIFQGAQSQMLRTL